MLTDRSYRRRLPLPEAVQRLRADAGSRYDERLSICSVRTPTATRGSSADSRLQVDFARLIRSRYACSPPETARLDRRPSIGATISTARRSEYSTRPPPGWPDRSTGNRSWLRASCRTSASDRRGSAASRRRRCRRCASSSWNRRCEQTEAGAVCALTLLLDLKDLKTGMHATRLAEWAVRVGEELGLGEEELRDIEYASMLHDVGKVGVPDEILFKPGRLTDDEFEQIKKHPEYGWAILRAVPGLESVSLVVLHHHERMDGKGYPAGLEGDQIPLGARIVCVVDAFDAMLSSRSYRKGLGIDEALTPSARLITRTSSTRRSWRPLSSWRPATTPRSPSWKSRRRRGGGRPPRRDDPIAGLRPSPASRRSPASPRTRSSGRPSAPRSRPACTRGAPGRAPAAP